MLPIFNKHRFGNRLTSDSDFYIFVIDQQLLVGVQVKLSVQRKFNGGKCVFWAFCVVRAEVDGRASSKYWEVGREGSHNDNYCLGACRRTF